MLHLRKIAAAGLALVALGAAPQAHAITGIAQSYVGGEQYITNVDGKLGILATITGASVNDTVTLADINGLVTSGASVIGVLAGDPDGFNGVSNPGEIQAGGGVPSVFDDLSGQTITVTGLSSGSGSVWDSLFLVFDMAFDAYDDPIAVLGKFSGGGTSTFAAGAGARIVAPSPVPLPAGVLLVGAAFATAGAVRRFGRRSA